MSLYSHKHTGWILKSVKEGGPVFDILAYDKESEVGVLRNVAGGAEFREKLAVDRLKKWGYKVVKKEQPNAVA